MPPLTDARAIKPSVAIGKTGGGLYDPSDTQIYFIAGDALHTLRHGAKYKKHCLIAVNELEDDSRELAFNNALTNGNVMFLDSGVFSLASEHARRHDISHDEGLKTPPEQLDGFQALFDRYLYLVRTYESRIWGYVEIDIGGTDQKRKTRAKLESLGCRPIPVYHPLNDGWDYFDELASKYNRICVGNIVQASRYVRLRIMATIWERKKKYPGLWIHLLGMTPNEWVSAYPMESLDSSTWLAPVRWPSAWKARAQLRAVSGFNEKYTYILGDMTSWIKAVEASGAQTHFNQLIMRSAVVERKEMV